MLKYLFRLCYGKSLDQAASRHGDDNGGRNYGDDGSGLDHVPPGGLFLACQEYFDTNLNYPHLIAIWYNE
jgi:hypothetical protein